MWGLDLPRRAVSYHRLHGRAGGGEGGRGSDGRREGPEGDLRSRLRPSGPGLGRAGVARKGGGRREFLSRFPCARAKPADLRSQTRTMTSRAKKFDPDLFCRAHGLKQGEFARLTRGSAARADRGGAKARKAEVIRLIKTLSSLMAPEELGLWIRKPNKGLKSLTPLEVIERGKTDRLWRMIYEVRSGQPD